MSITRIKFTSKTLVALTISSVSFVPFTAASVSSSSSPVVELPQWITTGPGVVYPDATDPTKRLSLSLQRTFACIRRYESRNHLVDGDGSEGWYQFSIETWDGVIRLAPWLHLPATPNQATGDQQSSAAVFEYERNGRFGVQWSADASRCPGVFYFSSQ
jgi:hypothetical protein